MKSSWFFAPLVPPLLLAISCGAVSAVEPNPKVAEVSKYMQAKLVHSQKILEALAVEDFEKLAEHSQRLELLSHESTWNVLQTEQYVQHSAEFRRRAAALKDAAQEKNLDGAALAFMGLTLNCIDCHKHVRDVRRVKVDARREPGKPASKPERK